MKQMTRGTAAEARSGTLIRTAGRRAGVWLLCGALSLLGCGHPGFSDPKGPRRASTRVEPAPGGRTGVAEGEMLRVVTFNIEYGDHVDQAAREMLGDPALANADVVAVQEVSGAEAERLATQLRMNFVYYPATLRNDDEFGNAILSRLPISRDWKLVLPHEPWGGGIRIAVGAELGTLDHRVVVYSVHNETFMMSPEERLDQVRRVIEDAEGRNLPVIVAGDFNTMDRYSRAETGRLFGDAGYLEASRNAGITAYQLGGLFTAILDHVFTRGFATVRSGTRGTASSDHRPLFAELELRSTPSVGDATSRGVRPAPGPRIRGVRQGR